MPSSQYHRIALIGFRCAGKTTLAKALGTTLRSKTVSTDHLIEEEVGMPIADFVRLQGWAAFRRVESRVIQRLPTDQPMIIDCGGGVVEDPENMRLLSRKTLMVWVDADITDLYERLQNAPDRPLLNQSDWKTDIDINYRRREGLYRQYSDLYVNTSRESPEAMVEKIVEMFGEEWASK